MEYRTRNQGIRNISTFPFVWWLIVPLVLLDISFEIYHRICFPIYGIKIIKRGNYIKIDRHKLKYLKWYDKINCAYCGYGNGLLHYVSTIAKETEKYWCGVKHQQYQDFIPPSHHDKFVEYGEKEQLNTKFPPN